MYWCVCEVRGEKGDAEIGKRTISSWYNMRSTGTSSSTYRFHHDQPATTGQQEGTSGALTSQGQIRSAQFQFWKLATSMDHKVVLLSFSLILFEILNFVY